MHLQADRMRLSDIEAQILDLERSLSALLAEKRLVQERIDSYRYPVLTLPNEIVSEILVHVLPPYPDPLPLFGTLSPTTLTHICRKWREVALATPMLWRAMRFFEFHPLDHQRRISDIWMRRSGSCPLSIQIVGHRSPCVSELLPAMVPHRARWGHLRLQTPQPSPSAIDGPMPQLLHLHLEATEAWHDVLAFREVPLLRSVVINTLALSAVILPWVQLTSLTLYSFKSSECIPILQQTPNLIHCSLHLWSDLDIIDHSGPDISLPCLESLAFRGSLGVVTKFLVTFIVPALRSLETPETFLWFDPIESLKSFISKSGCELQDVCISGNRTTREAAYFVAFPSIPNFSFTGPYIREWNDDEESEDESNSDSSDGESDSDSV
ncbi:F-box domain-containing protein [Mycena venus]|uniref:F-box domain-containing protein n=1 Tax=Mycena venus TaxID=2733690 RepID=A0A8H6XMS7_9AGAR|nr:F-box domain-containing protein [Mycena venus]